MPKTNSQAHASFTRLGSLSGLFGCVQLSSEQKEENYAKKIILFSYDSACFLVFCAHPGQALTSTRYPTWPELFFATRTWPELFFKISEFRVFSSSLFPSRPLQTFYNHPQILLFSSRPNTKSSVPKLKCLRYKRWIQGKSQKFDDWFIMHFDLFQSTQSNPRFIHIKAIKSINQDSRWLLSDEAHAL